MPRGVAVPVSERDPVAVVIEIATCPERGEPPRTNVTVRAASHWTMNWPPPNVAPEALPFPP